MIEARIVDTEVRDQERRPEWRAGATSGHACVEGACAEPGRAARRRWWRLPMLLVALTAGAAGAGYWWTHRPPPLPAGIATGNGRIEADPIDIATKFAGRIAELRVDEGDMAKSGQVLAVMDTRDLEASLKKAQAQVEQAGKAIVEAKANVDQYHTQVVLAEQEMERARNLLKSGWITKELVDQRQQQLSGARANEAAATARVRVAENLLEAAEHDVELYKVNIADNTLVAPRDGRIEYRLANVGEVLPAGGKVFTMLDIGNVYMDIYLPTADGGQVKIGSDARIVLDAYPDRPIPAKVTFLGAQAQFTPKTVETQTERDKLMFRVRVRIDPGATARSMPKACAAACPASPTSSSIPRSSGRRRCKGSADHDWSRRPGRRDSQGVSHRYGEIAALDGLSFDIPAGCMVGLIGPDGVGKSSLLGLIAGAKRIQDGRVEVLGGDMVDARHRASICPRIAYHAAGPGQEPLSRPQRAREHRVLRPAVRPAPRRARPSRSPSCCEAPASRRSPTGRPSKLSGGMRQKLGLCCALIHDPDLLILDEPTTGVDPLSRRQFWELIERMRLRRPGMSVIVATAYMEEAERFDWLVAMNAGNVLATARPASSRRKPARDASRTRSSRCCPRS